MIKLNAEDQPLFLWSAQGAAMVGTLDAWADDKTMGDAQDFNVSDPQRLGMAPSNPTGPPVLFPVLLVQEGVETVGTVSTGEWVTDNGERAPFRVDLSL